MKIKELSRDDLLYYGVQYFRMKGGYIPKIAPDNECNRVEFTTRVKWLYLSEGYMSSSYTSDFPSDDDIGHVHILEINAKLCLNCVFALRHYYDSDTIRVWSSLERDELCHACAAYKHGSNPDDIPF